MKYYLLQSPRHLDSPAQSGLYPCNRRELIYTLAKTWCFFTQRFKHSTMVCDRPSTMPSTIQDSLNLKFASIRQRISAAFLKSGRSVNRPHRLSPLGITWVSLSVNEKSGLQKPRVLSDFHVAKDSNESNNPSYLIRHPISA